LHTIYVLLDALMRQYTAAIDIDFVTNGDIVSENRHVLKTSPLANAAIPANNAALDPSVVLNLAISKHDTSLETNTIANHNIRADSNIRANLAVLANLGRRVNQDIAAMDPGSVGRGQELRLLLSERREVQASTSQEILGLSNIHPEAIEVE